MAVCSEIHTKHINTAVWGQNVELLDVKLVVHIVTQSVPRSKHSPSLLQKPVS